MSLLAPAWERLRAKRPEFAAAEKVWADVLEPELARREVARKTTISDAIKQTALIGAGAFFGLMIIGLIMGWTRGGGIFVILFVSAFLAAAGSAFKWLPIFTMKTQLKDLVLGAATQSFGFTYDTLHPDVSGLTGWRAVNKLIETDQNSVTAMWNKDKTEAPTPAFERLKSHALLPSYDSRKFEDLITGTRAGAEFSLVECKLTKQEGSGKNRRTVTKFQGVLLNIDYPDNFLGRTLLARSGWWKRGKEAQDLKKVQLVSIELDKAFTVYSTDQVEARTLLTPDRMERLIRLERHFKGGKLRGIFEDGHMTLALEADDQFEAGSIFKPLVDPTRYITALEEIGTICDLIDGFLTREWRGKPEN